MKVLLQQLGLVLKKEIPCVDSRGLRSLLMVSPRFRTLESPFSVDASEGEPVPLILTREFARLLLRVHNFLANVPLHDISAIDLPDSRVGIALDEFLRSSGFAPSLLGRMLLNTRLVLGLFLGWDCEQAGSAWQPFARLLTNSDRSRSLPRADCLSVLMGSLHSRWYEALSRNHPKSWMTRGAIVLYTV